MLIVALAYVLEPLLKFDVVYGAGSSRQFYIHNQYVNLKEVHRRGKLYNDVIIRPRDYGGRFFDGYSVFHDKFQW